MTTLERKPSLALLAMVLLLSCGRSNSVTPDAGPPAPGVDAGAPPPVETVAFESPQENLDEVQYQPSFEADYNRLVPRPEVRPASQAQQDAVSVFPDRLVFPASMSEVLTWEAGRIVAAAPGAPGSAGKNPFGFARRVVSVEQLGNEIIVVTQAVGLEEMFEGDVQVFLDPDAGVDVDLSKADLDWVVNNLYQVDPDAQNMPGELLTDDFAPEEEEPLLWGFFKKAVRAVVKVVKAAVQPLIRLVTPAYLGSGSVSLAPEITASEKLSLFDVQHSKTFTSRKGTSIEALLKAQGSSDISLTVKPGLQFGAKIATPLRTDAHSQYWMNVDTYYRTKIALDLALEASIQSAGGQAGSALEAQLNASAELAEEYLSAHRERMFGDPDLAPAGGWKRTLVVSKPKTNTFMAGVVPVVVVSTLQVDLECGFQAKAAINTHLEWEKTETFKFQAKYTSGQYKLEITGPTVNRRSNHRVRVTGAGEASVSCGLIPRVNVLLYDTVGIFAGVRGSLVASAQYESACTNPDPTDFHPVGTVSLGLYGNVGIQAGGRVQAPGSSLLGKSGTAAGFDVGPLELYNTQFPLLEKSWAFSRGFGYCTPACRNGTKDGTETDVDCGGACGSCANGLRCKRNTDCRQRKCGQGTCSADTCLDGVMDGTETDVDCGGGTCGGCGIGRSCLSGRDCASGYCAAPTTSTPDRCVTDHCADGVRDADEGGVDCGGATCAGCAVGVKVRQQADCASGHWNGFVCVASHCEDTVKSGNESGADCGGSTCPRRCDFLMPCNAGSDCMSGLSCTAGACRKLAGASCTAGTECASNECASNVCQAAPCQSARDCQAQESCVAGSCVPGRSSFATRSTFSGNLGGLTGADASCQAAAANAGLAGTYKAWLSSTAVSALSRLSHASVPYRLVDGTVVAQDWAALASASHAAPISKDEYGADLVGEVWTGTSPTGGIQAAGCNDWTSNDVNAPNALVGFSSFKDQFWTARYLQFCNRTNVRLYCLEQ